MGLSPWFLERRENQDIFQLEFGETLIGRTETTQIVIASVFASRRHCTITVSQTNPEEVYLEDLGTCNGTWINTTVRKGDRIRLREGDNIGIGCSIADHDEDKYYTFTLKRDNVSIDNIIINIDDDEEEEEEDDDVEELSVEEIEDDIEEVALVQEDEIKKVTLVQVEEIEKVALDQEEKIDKVDLDQEEEIVKVDLVEQEEEIVRVDLEQEEEIENVDLEQEEGIENVELEQEEDIEKELSYSLKQDMMDENIEIEDIFSDCEQKIEENCDLFHQYKIKQEESLREPDIVLISDSEEEDIEHMNKWVLKLSQNIENKRSYVDIKQESDEENNDDVILHELRSVLGNLPDDDGQNVGKPDESITVDENIETVIPKFEIDDDDFVQIADPSPLSQNMVHKVTTDRAASPNKSIPPMRRCSVVLDKIDLLQSEPTLDSIKIIQDLDSEDEVRPPKKKYKRLFSKFNKTLFGPDDDDNEDAAKILKKKTKQHTKHHSDVKTAPKTSDNIKKRKASLEPDEATKKRSVKEKSDRPESSSSNIRINGGSNNEHKRRRSSSKEQLKSKHGSKSKSREDQRNEDLPNKSSKKVTPECDSDFIENPVPKKTSEPNKKITQERESNFIEKSVSKTKDETIKLSSDHKKPRQLEVIEALNMPDRRRGSDKMEKEKILDSIRRAQSRAVMAQKNENNIQNLKKKYKQRYSADKKRSRREKLKVSLEQKNRLAQIALASKHEKIDDEVPKVVNMPKVKMTEQNRGSFLTEALPCKIPARRKSVSATDTRTYLRPGEESKIAKLPSINDLGTVGKSISAFPKIPKVTRSTSVETCINSAQPKPPNVEPIITLQTSLTKTALKPRVARTVCDETIKSVSSLCPLIQFNQKPEVLPQKSILTKRTSTQQIRKPKNVRFSDDVSVRLFEVIYEKKLLNVSEAKLKENIIANMKKIGNSKIDSNIVKKSKGVSLNFHPCENVVNEITSWNPDWLKMRPSVLPPVNGSNILLPIVHTFRNCTEYENIIIPLLKVELWHQIRNDYEMSKNVRCLATVESVALMPKGNGMRYEFVFELHKGIDGKIPEQIKEGMLLKVSSADKHFFAYMVFKHIVRSPDRQVIGITIQSAQSAVTDTIEKGMVMEITSIAYVRVEVINMGFIFDLKESPLCDMILNPPIHIEVPNITDEYDPVLDVRLNENQYNIVKYTTKQCLEESKPSIVLIDGPPGTGKSYLISNLVSTLLYLPENVKLKILICSASNNAIDIIMEKLIEVRLHNKKMKNQRDIRLLRNGVLEKMSPAVQAYSVQNLCKHNFATWKREVENAAVMNGASITTLLNERKMLEARINYLNQNGCSSSKIDEMSRLEKDLNQVKGLIKGSHIAYSELRDKEKQLVTSLICKADVICTTLASCVHLMKQLRSMDVCIIDEATQCTEPWSIIPLKFKIKTLILVGDTKQLPAVVLSPDAKDKGLSNSLFTRIQHSFEVIAATPVLPMTTQYRMHPEINEFPNKYFYDDQLKSCYKINADVPLRPYSVVSLDFIQSASNNSNNSSVCNKDEAKFISHLLYEISNLVDLKKVQIGIITPYQLQKTEIIKALSVYNFKDINVNTIDSFQGKEADIIILATTRTTGAGFLGHPQRLNVALTRARHSLIICGNFINLKHVPIWSSLIEDAKLRQLFYEFDHNFKNLLHKLTE